MSEVDRLAELIMNGLNLIPIEYMAEVLLLVLDVEGMRAATTVSNHLAVLDRREGVFMAIQLVVHAVVEVVTLICFHDNWKVISIPVICAWNQSQKQLIEVVLRKRTSLVQRAAVVQLLARIFLSFVRINELVFAS